MIPVLQDLGWRRIFKDYYWYSGPWKRWEYDVGLGFHYKGFGYHYKSIWGCKWGKIMKFSWKIEDYD